MISRLGISMLISTRWPNLTVNCSDRVYADGIDSKLVHKAWRRWKFGWLGFGGQPLYKDESQDCDDLVRNFIVYFRRKYKVKAKAQPIFYTAYAGHAYVSYIDENKEVKSMDLRVGKLYEIESFIVEML